MYFTKTDSTSRNDNCDKVEIICASKKGNEGGRREKRGEKWW